MKMTNNFSIGLTKKSSKYYSLKKRIIIHLVFFSLLSSLNKVVIFNNK